MKTGSLPKLVREFQLGIQEQMKRHKTKSQQPAFLFDLDGTLIDSVYEHSLAWQQALEKIGICLPVATIHRRIGMSGETIIHAFQRESKTKLSPRDAKKSEQLHTAAFRKHFHQLRPLPGARELLHELTRLHVPWAIATSGQKDDAEQALALLRLKLRNAVVVTKDDVEKTKPEPDLFLAAAARLKMELENCVVVGDSIWDLLAAQRARAIGVGFLSGGVGQDELERAGAYRVYRDAADLLSHLDDFGILSD